MAYNTGNPIGSADPRDLYDNAKNFDQAINSEAETFVDRLGVPRKTWHAIEEQVDQQEAEFDADQTRREDEFDVAQSYRSSQYIAAEDARNLQTNEFIANHGNYVPVGDYAAGIEISQYNEVVRDAAGEFWRLSGIRELPYTTTGSGLPEGGAFVPVGDAALRQQLAGPAGYRLVSNQMAPNAYGVPGPLRILSISNESVVPVDFFHGYFWGREGNNIHRSTDGANWELYAAGPGRPGGFSRILPTSDGEVLVVDSESVQKSTGWQSGSPSWSTVMQNPSSGSDVPILQWGVDGNEQKFIVTHYGAGSSNWEESRYVWISVDAGDTWSVVWDTQSQFPGQSGESHLHAVCYDPWWDRFYLAEGHGTPAGIYYSDNDGTTWTKINNANITSPTYTTMVASEFGIVCGSDSEIAGIFVITPGDSADSFTVERFGEWQTITPHFTGLWGFADRGHRDPDTGIVYTSFFSQSPNAHCVIMACGAMGASVVYEGPVERRIPNVVAAKGVLLAITNFPEGNVLRAATSRYGSPVG